MSLKIFSDIDELLSLKGAYKKQARFVSEKDLSIIKKATIVTYRDQIIWVGSYRKLSDRVVSPYGGFRKARFVSLKGLTVAPSFVECHTHLLFGGHRFRELELRNQGVSYTKIHNEGGGILSTVRATRKLSLNELYLLGQQRVNSFLRQGVGTVEIKTGYALTRSGEIKMLEAMNLLKKIRVSKTFLACHTFPPELSKKEYFTTVIDQWLPEIVKSKNCPDRVDIFVEKGIFTKAQARQLFLKAKQLNLKFTIHADQLSERRSSLLAGTMGASSVDHVNFINKQDIYRIASSNTAVVFLPVADFYLKMAYPKARAFLDAGARVALATDFNPGTAPSQDISFVGLLARKTNGNEFTRGVGSLYSGWGVCFGIGKKIGKFGSE